MTRPFSPRQSLAARLALVFCLISGLAVVVMGLGIYLLTAHYTQKGAADDLEALAEFYAAYAAATAHDETSLAAMAPQIAGFFAPQADYDVRLYEARTGSLLAATRDIGALPSNATRAQLIYRRPWLLLTPGYDQPQRIYTARSVTTAAGTVLAVVEVSRDVGEARAFLATLRLALFGTGALALSAALAASLALARQMTRPLSQMEAATKAIASGDFSRRLEIYSRDEIGRLAESVNHMAADLARLEAARREFIARISHDLRTPLTAIKGMVVNLQDSAPATMQASLATMDEQTERLIRLVNDLLTLSRLQRGDLRLARGEIDLAAVAHSAVALGSEKAARLGIDLSLEAPDRPPLLYGDADRLQQVVVNLVDNAIKATPPAGGAVQVRITADEGQVTLLVQDNGRGLTPEEKARAFEAYYRGAGGGAGLGLTIAREIVSAHGGQIWLQARPEGGAEAGFSLPVSPGGG
jgi:signal transduction histidine kinase